MRGSVNVFSDKEWGGSENKEPVKDFGKKYCG